MTKTQRLLVKSTDPILKTRCDVIDLHSDARLVRVCMEKMRTVMKAEKSCVGLAAPQIGYSIRLFATQVASSRSGVIARRFYANPVIERSSEETEEAIEGCLSFPGKFAPIRRATGIAVSALQYLEGKWARVQFEAVRFEARVIQHEIDHLNGICRVGEA